MSNQPAPEGLERSGARLWAEITEKWKLRPDELRILEDACFEADLVDVLQAGLKGADLMVRGSQGQQVANPLFAEARQHRSTFKSLIRSLNLPDEQGSTPRSVGARKAAAARWSKTA